MVVGIGNWKLKHIVTSMCDWPSSKSTQPIELDPECTGDENTATSCKSQKLCLGHVSNHVNKIARNALFSRILKRRKLQNTEDLTCGDGQRLIQRAYPINRFGTPNWEWLARIPEWISAIAAVGLQQNPVCNLL